MRAERATVRRGFSLLEVLVAVIVLALALVALTKSAGSQALAFEAQRERTLAGWLAQTVLAEARIAHRTATGKSDGKRRFAGREWTWELKIEPTQASSIRRLNVRVFAPDDASAPMAELSGFAGDDLQW